MIKRVKLKNRRQFINHCKRKGIFLKFHNFNVGLSKNCNYTHEGKFDFKFKPLITEHRNSS